MKAYKTLLFIIVCILLLGVLAYFFPKDGIQVGNITFRFPSLEKVLGSSDSTETVVNVEETLEAVKIEQIDTLNADSRDSLNYFHTFTSSHPTRFYLPNDNIKFFDPLFAELEKAQAGGELVHILHYGDSQIEVDRMSNNLRRFFQKHFGGSGIGLIPVGETGNLSGVKYETSGNVALYGAFGNLARHSTRSYGISGKTATLSGNATIRLSHSHKNSRFSRIQLLFNDLSGNLQATLSSSASAEIVEKESYESGVQLMTFTLDTPSTDITLNLSGNADLYGIFYNSHGGVTVDNIPHRGSSGTGFTKTDGAQLAACYHLMNVGAIILQFGGNSVPYLLDKKSINGYVKSVERQIQFLHRIYPRATLIFVGPSDMATKIDGTLMSYPMLPYLCETLRKAANDNGAAYFDMHSIMGGRNSMIAWVNHNPQLAGPDYIHFTPAGANKMGNILSDSFNMMYELYNYRKTMSDTSFVKTWNELPQSNE